MAKRKSYPSPFDDSAVSRLVRMGILEPGGAIREERVAVLAQAYAALFFEQLCDTLSDMEKVAQLCAELDALEHAGNTRQMLLAICVQYDAMLRPLPEPIWWSVGNEALIDVFIRQFVRFLTGFLQGLDSTGE